MNTIELLELINKEESYHLEFKLEDENNEDFAKTIVCFANTDGGKILIGVDDNGNIIGVEEVDKVMFRLDDIAMNRCAPPVSIIQESVIVDDKKVVIVHIDKGSQRPYRTKSGQYYVRASNRCRQASREELLRIFQTNQSLYYDELPVTRAILSDLDLSAFKDFLSNYLDITIENNNDLKNFLINFHLLSKNDIPTITGILFFGKEPQKFIPEARVICANISGTDFGDTALEHQELKGTIPVMIIYVENFLKSNLKKLHQIKDFSPESEYEIPLTALREAVINAIAHRDYTISAPIRVILFADRIEIHSPGILPNTVTVESMKVGGSHVLRNPTIYNLLVKMKMVTDLGSGVRRMIKLIKEHTNKEVDLITTENEFIVKIPRK
ncbi:MAG TPA: putative DNA binding domain-containing protein [Defluviitoga tunisiensis]|nr:putative DNA binding domain-containing protein [Defluviitoga tunisiensis]